MVISVDQAALRRKYAEERDKRLRPDGNEQYVRISDEFHTSRWDYAYTGGDYEGAPMDKLAGKREGQDAGPFLGRGYPYGPSAYFTYIDQWRTSGTFDGLEFRP
jgi:hypothetical protein